MLAGLRKSVVTDTIELRRTPRDAGISSRLRLELICQTVSTSVLTTSSESRDIPNVMLMLTSVFSTIF